MSIRRRTRPFAIAISVMALTGCVSQRLIEHRHWELNDSIHQTSLEQLLLNIVRLRYDEMPYFLQVSSVSTQFSAQTSASASGTMTQSAPSVLGIGGSISYSENPVVTWSLPDSREYLGRLLAPMSADQLTVLAQSGWDPQRVLRVGVKKMNRLRNKDFSIDEGILTPATYEPFVEALKLVGELRKDDLVDLAYGVMSNSAGGKVPMDRMDVRAMADGLGYGLQFMTRDDPRVFEPLKLSKPLFLRFSKASDADPRARRLRELLNLAKDKYSFAITDTMNSGKEQLLSESGKLTRVYDPASDFNEIVLNNRSVMEVLYFASTFVQVPEEHLARGYVDQRSSVETPWLDVRVSTTRPSDVWLRVSYHDYWFYIAADDMPSRASFTLLDALFASVVGNVPGAKPLLTLPVR